VLTLLVQAIAISDMFTREEMRDDVLERTGTWRRTADANVVRAGLAIVIMMLLLEGPAGAQPGTDPAVTIPVHPNVTTTLHMPDEVLRVRFTVEIAGLIGAINVGNMVLIRLRPGMPAGEEVRVTVWTATLRWRLRLRVVRHARDALKEIAVVAADAEPAAVDAVCNTGKAAPVESSASTPTSALGRGEPEPSASAPASTPGPAEPEPSASASASAPGPAEPSAPEGAVPAGAVTTEPGGTAGADRDDDATGSPRFEVSVHAVAALVGTTELAVAGYEAIDARQPHRAFGMRVAVAPHGAWWAVETSVSGEWLAAPTVHGRDRVDEPQREVVEVNGPLLRADVGMRARFGTPWSPTAYAGIGLLVHHRNIEHTDEDPFTDPMTQDDEPTRDMPLGGVLALGLGLEYQAEKVLLGLDLQVRQGVPADYRSVAAVLSVGCFLNQGE
jgi:hypothetical protein